MSAIPDAREAPRPTPTQRGVALRPGDFPTLLDALDYAAESATGVNFHDGRGRLQAALPWGEVRRRAVRSGGHLAALALPRGSHVGIVAETRPDFLVAFFACRFAALTPVPLPATIHMGGHEAYVGMLDRLLDGADARACLGGEEFAPYLAELGAARLAFRGTLDELAHTETRALPARPGPEEIAYIQYTSGSTRFPRGAMLTERATLRNVAGIVEEGLRLDEDDRFCSWLPLYHDMGLIGKMIVPMASQCSIDYLGTREFAMRPRLWLRLLSDRRGTISFSPPFGYEITARRLRPGDADGYDLRHWRVAGCGADMIRPDVLERFADALAPAGFVPRALTPSYGMAEVSLAVSFSPLERGFTADEVDLDRFEQAGCAQPATVGTVRSTRFTCCGRPLTDYEVEIRDDQGRPLGDREVGSVHLRTPSTMEGYYAAAEINRSLLVDGWLDTGDLGYTVDGELIITGRRNDLMIINGRNIWPQDVEHIAEYGAGVRTGDAAAFTVADESGSDTLVVLLQCREQDAAARARLLKGIRRDIQAELGIEAHVTPVPPHSLPRTTSGKLSRAQARIDYLAGRLEGGDEAR